MIVCPYFSSIFIHQAHHGIEMSLEYDVLIATRNRLKALQLCIPLVLTQTILPRRLIIVDSSEYHDAVCDKIENMASSSQVKLQIVKSEAGTAHQRNVGLKHVQSPVVMMPDDDSLWYPDFAENVMRIYEKDTNVHIGGVGGIGIKLPPLGTDTVAPMNSYKMTIRDRLKGSLDFIFRIVEKYIFHDPFDLLGQTRRNVKPFEPWLLKEKALFLPKMDGYRMSFRTALIKPYGFDEVLGQYALFEDYDAGFSISGHHLVVQALKARMHHYKSPERRTNGLEWGVIQVLNRAYIVCKHTPPGSLPRQQMNRFLRYRFAKSLPRIHSRWTRDRLRGMFRSLPLVRKLIASPLRELPEAYLRARNFCLRGK